MTEKRRIKSLYYITHTDNLPSILQRGILSHAMVEQLGLPFAPVYDAAIVTRRRDRLTPNGVSLWEFANLYFQPRNPMLYRVLAERDEDHIAVIGVRPQVLDLPGTLVSTGGAAHSLSDIVPASEGIAIITREIWPVLASDWWREEDGSKRKIMAECLVPRYVPPDLIQTVYVANCRTAERIRNEINRYAPTVGVVAEPHMFFRPRKQWPITDDLSLAEGDMFFSHMQTLTISVNTVGVMGKGLASRAKYQFPDVYVFYQDLCRSKQLRMGRPYLYKREVSLDRQLADDSVPLPEFNASKWFLLFPTKRHWRERSDIGHIDEGLQWVVNHYKVEGIQSLAVPALGCGLGGLDWRDVGPLMVRHLNGLGIPVVIYLPQEKEIASEYLTREYLLGS